jgi:hypothetical protein
VPRAKPSPSRPAVLAESLSDVFPNLDSGVPSDVKPFSLDDLPEKDLKVVRFVLGKKASRDLDAAGFYIIRRGESITEDVVGQAIEHDMLTLLFLAASDAG